MWFLQDGLGKKTSWLNSKNLCRKLALILKAPVPKMSCTLTYQPVFNNLLLLPEVDQQMHYRIQSVLQRQVFFVQNFCSNLDLCFLGTRKHARLSNIILVATTSQINLFAAGVSIIGFCDSQDRILGPHVQIGLIELTLAEAMVVRLGGRWGRPWQTQQECSRAIGGKRFSG